MLFIGAAWNIHGQKELITADDYNTRCDGLAARMVQPDGTPIKPKRGFQGLLQILPYAVLIKPRATSW